MDSAPSLGDQIAWGESNAVVFANSVLGARTQKYADYLDICAAITGRVPLAGPHLDQQRVATVVLDATTLAKEGGLGDSCADAFFPALGYLCGLRSEARVPVITGLENREVTMDELKAFSGALAAHCPDSKLYVRQQPDDLTYTAIRLRSGIWFYRVCGTVSHRWHHS